MTDQTPVPTAPAQQPAPSHTLRTVLLVVGSIVLAIVLLVTVVRVVHTVNRQDTSGTFTVGDRFDSVVLDTSAADVDIRFGNVTRTELHFDQGDTELQLDQRVSGDELHITVKRPGWGWWGWGFGAPFGDWGIRGAAQLQVVLPQTLQRDGVDLVLDSTAGDLTVSGDFDDVELESTAGDVRLSGSADDLDVKTTAGEIRVSDFSVNGQFRSESTAGGSRFDFRTLPESIDVKTTAGEVRVTLPDGSYRIETSTTAGDVRQHVSSDANSNRVYRFETTAGDIEISER